LVSWNKNHAIAFRAQSSWEVAMKGKSEEQRKRDHTLVAAGALVVAGLMMLGIPPWILFGI
jgi:hypothetical protein